MGKTKEEKKADLNRYKALKKAAEATARKHRGETFVHKQLNDAIIEAEKNVSKWRR